MSTGQGCDSPSGPVTLMCTGTATLITALRSSKPKFGFHGIHSNMKTHIRECDLRGIWYTQLLSGDNCLFHLPDILEMPLVIVASESKADIRVVCLQPQAVIAGENFPRPWEVLGLSPPGGQRGLEKSLSGDKWDFCSVISTAWCLLILELFFLLPEFSCNCCKSRCLLHSFYFSRGEEQRGSVCLLHWPHPRCSLAVLVHADSREGADKQFHSVAHTWVSDAVWDAWVVQNTLMGWQTWCRACSKPIFSWLAAGNQVWCPMASQIVFVPCGWVTESCAYFLRREFLGDLKHWEPQPESTSPNSK